MHTTDILSRTALIDALADTEKLLARTQAAKIRLLAALAQSRGADPLDCTEEEVGAALRWSPNTARTRLHIAESLNVRFPETLDLMAAGRVSPAQANALVEITAGLELETARAAQARVLPRLPQQGRRGHPQSTASRRAGRRPARRAQTPPAGDEEAPGDALPGT